MKKLLNLTLLVGVIVFASCTDNQMARQYGGTEYVNLEPGQKLVSATWKELDLWYLTEPMSSSDVPRTLTFKEKSSYGVMEGTIIFKESK